MANYINSTITSGVAKAIHAGVNWAFATHTLNETGSGSMSISMIKLPAGAKVVDCYVMQDNTGYGTGAETLCVKSHLGQTYIATAAMSTAFHAFNPTYASIGYRLTSSSHIQVSLQGLVGTGTASMNISLAVAYTAEHDGD